MKISKHLHSCLLIENQDQVVLIDPGKYSYDEKALDINSLSRLDVIAITHEHLDHLYVPFIQDLLQKFPKVQIISNSSVVDILAKEQIIATVKNNEYVKTHSVPHEKVFMAPPAQNILVTVFDRLSHPGDSLTFSTNSEILALPITAPWGSTTWAVEKALMLKPKIILPIHDWHWKDEVRRNMYLRLEEYFGKNQIIFKKMETGEVIEV